MRRPRARCSGAAVFITSPRQPKRRSPDGRQSLEWSVAGRLAGQGRTTALVEAHLIGGECAFYACMPSKALLRPPELYEEAKRVLGVREAVTGDLDARAVLRRRDEVIHGLDDSGQEPWLQERGVTIVRAGAAAADLRAGRVPAPALREQGVDILTVAPAARVQRDGAGEVALTLENGRSLQGNDLLVAVGRKPLTDDLGLETVGIEAGGALEVDDRMQVTGQPWLDPIGDVNGRALLTHVAKYQARSTTLVLDGDERARAIHDGPGSPRVIFTEPQIAAVGMTEAGAREAGIEVRTVLHSTSAIAGASFVGRHTPGATQLVVDGRRDIIVGATFVGFEVAELLQAATIAIVNQVPIAHLWACLAPFPTRSEIWLRLLDAYEAG